MKTFILRDLNKLTENGWKPLATVYAETLDQAIGYAQDAYKHMGLELREFCVRSHSADLKVFDDGYELGFFQLEEKNV